MVQGILDGMRWLGLEWDEGPFFQSKRLSLYQSTAEKLRESGHAYYCFCTKEDLEQRRLQAAAAGKPPMYDRRCRGDRSNGGLRAASGAASRAPCASPCPRAE